MKTYTSIQEVSTAFKSGQLSFNDESFTIGVEEFVMLPTTELPFIHYLNETKNGIVYTSSEHDIVLIYKGNYPCDAVAIPKLINEDKERTILGEVADVRFTSLPSSSILKGKVDTGATICSLHCDDYNINQESQQITFTCTDLSNNKITVPLVNMQAVKNSQGVDNRPVIEMSVKIGEQTFEGIQFNLNNREKMDYPVLIGQNLLDKGKFLIDPTLAEGVNWELVNVVINEIELDDNAELNRLYYMLSKSNHTLQEVISHAARFISDHD